MAHASRPSTTSLEGPWGPAVTLGLVAILLGGPYLAATLARRRAREAREAERMRTRTALVEAAGRRHQVLITRLRSEIEGLRRSMAPRAEVEAKLGAVEQAVAGVEQGLPERVAGEVQRTLARNPRLEAARAAAARLRGEAEDPVAVIAREGRAVCLIQGAYGFGRCDARGRFRFLREATPEILDGRPVAADKVALTLEGDGPRFRIEYIGTGFLADASGILLTNRHIAEPWWRSEAAAPLLKDGYEPRFLRLVAYFPGRPGAVPLRTRDTCVSREADLAALYFQPFPGQPEPLELAPDADAPPGTRVLLLGYPSGLDAILARADEEFVARLRCSGAGGTPELLDALARAGLVRPLPTHGHIGDVLADRVLFDAATAVGGSGGPLLDLRGRVVAVNYGILKAFRGANFGVPVRFARRLLARARQSG